MELCKGCASHGDICIFKLRTQEAAKDFQLTPNEKAIYISDQRAEAKNVGCPYSDEVYSKPKIRLDRIK